MILKIGDKFYWRNEKGKEITTGMISQQNDFRKTDTYIPKKRGSRARLTWDQVCEIRERIANGEKCRALAVEFDTHWTNIWAIATYKSRPNS